MELGKKEAGKIMLKALLEKQKLSAEETERRFQLACSPDYWRQLNPQLKVCENLPFDDMELNPVSFKEHGEMLDDLDHKGYFVTARPLIKREVADNMLKAVENLRKEGWHEVWAFVYDEFWQVTRTPSMLKLLSDCLGENFKAMPHVVVHYVHPGTGTGWSPHIDFSDRDDRFTVWFSLSDATINNGCIYVIAQHRVSAELLEKWTTMQDLNHREVKTLLQGTRALPVEAGSILAWEGDVIHWGTFSSDNVLPRVSLSVVYLRENIEPLADEIPLLSPVELPSYAARMLSVGKAIGYYSIHVLALNKFKDVGAKLIAQYKPEAMTTEI
jgi:hypothetical protein